MAGLCPSCNSTSLVFDYEHQSQCCSACGLVLGDEQIYEDNNNHVNDSESANNATIPPLLKARYQPIFEQLQGKFEATDEETDFVRQLCFLYLSHPQHIFENSALEVVLCLFYLVVLQHRQDQSLLLLDYCHLVDVESKRCLTIYAAIRRLVSMKLATLPSDYDPHHQLDNVMRFLYPALLQSTPSSPTIQHHHEQQRLRPLFYYHATPVMAYSKSKRLNKDKQPQQRKRQKSSTTIESTRSPLSSLTPETTVTTDIDPPPFDTNTERGDDNGENHQHHQQQTNILSTTTTTTENTDDDDSPAKLGRGEPVLWPTNMDDMKIRQQTARLMTLVKLNGLAEGRYGRPLMSACLLITMLGWFHQHQQQKQEQEQQSATVHGVKKAGTRGSRSVSMLKKAGARRSRAASMLPVVMIDWDELDSRKLVNSTTKSRYNEVIGLLHTLGKTLPWLKDNLSMKRDVLHYLDDILQMMDVLQNNNNNSSNNQLTNGGNTTTTTTVAKPSSSRLLPATATLPPSSPDTTTTVNTSSTSIAPFLPPSFERATRIRQKRLAELDLVDQWHHDPQQNITTAIWEKDSGVADSVRMVASLVASQQYDREAILAMSDNELVNHAYRVTSSSSSSSTTLGSNNTIPSSTLDLDRQLDDFDLSNEELASYLV